MWPKFVGFSWAASLALAQDLSLPGAWCGLPAHTGGGPGWIGVALLVPLPYLLVGALAWYLGKHAGRTPKGPGGGGCRTGPESGRGQRGLGP